MGLYLVRHAHAGRRSAWKGNDAERPLSDRGRAQAAGILDLIPVRVTAVLSSPAVRCVQTVEAVAERAGLPLQLEAGLFEGSDTARTAKQLRHLLREDAEAHVVACSHGDLIPALIARWASDGAELDPDQHTAKGSTWILDVAPDGRVTGGRYVQPTA
jgi:8-oxo-dGTP diphosphatase